MFENTKNWILQNILSNVKEHNSAKLIRESFFKVMEQTEQFIVATGAGLYTSEISPSSQRPNGLNSGVFLVTEQGTYTNFGNVVLPANSFGFILWNGAAFTISTILIPTYDATPLLNRMTALENEWDNYAVEVDQEFVNDSENAVSSKAISDFFLEKIEPIDGYVPVEGIIKYAGKEFKSGAIVDSIDCDLYVVPITAEKDVYIDALVGSQSNRRAIYAFNSIKELIPGGYINDFLNNNSLTEKKAVQKSLFTVNGVAYIAFNNLKSNANVGAFVSGNYQTYGKIKKELIEIDSNRYYTVKNLIPSNLGTLQIHKAQNNTGEVVDEANYIMYKLEHSKISNGKLVISVPTTYPFINVFDSNNNFIRSISIQPTIENVIDLNTIGGSYIIFSFSSTSTASGWFSLNYSKNNSEPIYNFLDYDYLYGGKKNRLSQHVTIQSLVDEINKNGAGTIYFPAGTYSLAESIVMKSNVSIKGDGEHLTIFKPRGRVPAFIGGNKNDYTSAITNVNFCDFSIDGELQSLSSTPYNSDIKGIHIVFLKNVTFRNLLIKNTGATGLGCDFFQSGLIENVRAENCGRLVDLTASSAPGASGIGIGTGAFMEGIETLTISNCHAINCGQNGIFIERQFQSNGSFETDHPVGTMVIGCTVRGCRIGFGTSGNDNLTFIGCTAYGNHHANFAYDIGTMNRTGSFGKFVKFIGCISKKAGKFMPENYPLYSGDSNGYGWYIKGNYDGIELTNCDSTENLKDGFFVKAGIKNMYINGGRFADNGENGINLNGSINKFKISPSVVENNTLDGLRINGNMTNGLIKDSIYTLNKSYGINKVSGTLTNVITKDALIYGNTVGQSNDITFE